MNCKAVGDRSFFEQRVLGKKKKVSKSEWGQILQSGKGAEFDVGRVELLQLRQGRGVRKEGMQDNQAGRVGQDGYQWGVARFRDPRKTLLKAVQATIGGGNRIGEKSSVLSNIWKEKTNLFS